MSFPNVPIYGSSMLKKNNYQFITKKMIKKVVIKTESQDSYEEVEQKNKFVSNHGLLNSPDKKGHYRSLSIKKNKNIVNQYIHSPANQIGVVNLN